MYKVIKDFTDLKDKDYIYHAGDPFPREGVEVSEERIKELASKNNKRNEVIIELVSGEDNQEPKLELENLNPEAIKEQYTNDEIKARLDELGIDYKSSDNKDKLIERLLKKDGDN